MMAKTAALLAELHSMAQAMAQAGQDNRTLVQDEARNERLLHTLSLPEGGKLRLDLTRQNISSAALDKLLELLEASEAVAKRDAMFAGQPINATENRAVMHMALRGEAVDGYSVNGQPVMPELLKVRQRLYDFAEAVRTGTWRGATGQKLTHVLHIGIGGSHLGPELVVGALRAYADGPQVRFIANVDPADVSAKLQGLDPATTLVIVASKTFTTQETMTNAAIVRQWVVAALGEAAVAQHFVAASTNEAAVTAFGILPQNMFPFETWVGGRFSLWSAIGLPILLSVGAEAFGQFLSGARAMDMHFSTAAPAHNLPMLLALVDVWTVNACGHQARAVLPYAQDLARLADFLQQLEMESNGKRVSLAQGQLVPYATSPVVFGQAGTNGQHAFHQQLHQGASAIPAEFIMVAKAHPQDEALAAGQHRLLVANALAQIMALQHGRQPDDPHRVMPGGRPSTLVLLDRLTPANFGALLALYEHKVATLGFMWGINSFDQFGVELGKTIATDLLAGRVEMMDPALRQAYEMCC